MWSRKKYLQANKSSKIVVFSLDSRDYGPAKHTSV